MIRYKKHDFDSSVRGKVVYTPTASQHGIQQELLVFQTITTLRNTIALCVSTSMPLY